MTKEKFERHYAECAGKPWAQLAEMGFRAIACDCGEPDCQGWRADCDPTVLQERLMRQGV